MGSEWLHTLDSEGRTPLDRAYKAGHPVLAELMLRQEKADQAMALASESPLHRAAYLGLASAVKSLITYGATDEAVDSYGETPLHKAVRQGHLATVEVLVRTSDVNATSLDGMTPLHWAVLTGREEIVQTLLLYGADAHMRNEIMDGLSPAAMARALGYGELVELFDGVKTYV
jgi:ankyrin repeat protein